MSIHQVPIFTQLNYVHMGSQNTVIGAIGAVLGYIGAEGATPEIFQRLLWPQRAHSGFTWRHALKLATLGPSGGPTYKAVLQVMDNAFAFGLLRGSGRGHMLGSFFFPQSTSTYTFHSSDARLPSHTEPARNCIWERVIAVLPVPPLMQVRSSDKEATAGSVNVFRAQVSVHHVILSICDMERTTSPALDVASDSERFSLQTVAGIVTSEITGIVFAVTVATIWKSWLSVLWICPLLIKLLSVTTALDREHLMLDQNSSREDSPEPSDCFEVHLPPESGAFLVLTGPRGLLLQFFRHFGHPKRNRLREIVQLALVVASGCLFPLGLLFSVTVMSQSIQYVWLSYQMYLVLTMYISRYMSLSLWSSTEELIAREFANDANTAYLWADQRINRVVKAELRTSLHARYGEAKNCTKQLIRWYQQSDEVRTVSGMSGREKAFPMRILPQMATA